MPARTYGLVLTKAQADLLKDAVATELEANSRYISRLGSNLRACDTSGQPERARQYKQLLANAQAGRAELQLLSRRLSLIIETPEED